MKARPKKSAAAQKPKAEGKPKADAQDFTFHLPLGTKLSDVYMDTAQAAQEMAVSKKTINNHRKAGRLPYSDFFGKYYYNRQLIAAMLAKAHKDATARARITGMLLAALLQALSGCFLYD